MIGLIVALDVGRLTDAGNALAVVRDVPNAAFRSERRALRRLDLRRLREELRDLLGRRLVPDLVRDRQRLSQEPRRGRELTLFCGHARDRQQIERHRAVEVVVSWIEDNVLREEIVVGVMAEIRRRIVARATTGVSELAEVEGSEKNLRAELARLVTALASGAESPTITEAIHERETRLAGFQARKQFLSTAPSAFNLEARRLEKEARSRLADMRAVLRRNPDEARKVVGSLLDGPLVFPPAVV